ncbi:MAG: MBL fold metallo-hydrolase [Oscillospiraceae bacterium]|nr:MBL fold metallo-hydrolase [Oscillospiraceae bacterium]
MAKVCPLFSGSSGNSYYIESGDTGILLDVGRSAKQIRERLEACNLSPEKIQGIFITHEHVDHVKGLRVFACKYHIPVYASAGTLQALEDSGDLAKVTYDRIPWEGMCCGDFFIRPFPTSHDCAESIGFQLQTSDEHTISLATDLGILTDPVKDALRQSDFVILESNHDIGMLQNGAYPYSLKRRILSPKGHLSNVDCADYLPELVRSGTTRMILSHLSHENNTPELALQTALCSLKVNGMRENVDYQLYVAPRENQTGRSILF